jgi:hypothetical protein
MFYQDNSTSKPRTTVLRRRSLKNHEVTWSKTMNRLTPFVNLYLIGVRSTNATQRSAKNVPKMHMTQCQDTKMRPDEPHIQPFRIRQCVRTLELELPWTPKRQGNRTHAHNSLSHCLRLGQYSNLPIRAATGYISRHIRRQ